MDKLSPAVLEAFGIHSRRVKKEKGRYICETPEGTGVIHITPEPAGAINLRHAIKEHLAERGFPQTDRYRLAVTGNPYIVVGRDTYVMTKASPGPDSRETDFENEPAVLQAFELLARFHIAAAEMPALPIPHMPKVEDLYARQLNELSQAGKQARRATRMSDFDVLYIKHSPRYIETMAGSISRLANTRYSALHAAAARRRSLCHNALKEENILTGSAPYIINFADAAIGPQISDLAALIRRYAQRSTRAIPIGRLLEAYDQVNPLPAGAGDMLQPLLVFPWAFTKIVALYYSKKRNWTPVGLLSRMEAILAEREEYEKYIDI